MDGFRSLKRIVESDFGGVTLRTRLVINLLDRKEKPELLGVPRIDSQNRLIYPKIEKINPILILIGIEIPTWNMPFVSPVLNGRIEISLEIATIRDVTTERTETTIEIVRVTREVVTIETVKVRETVKSPSTSQIPPHLARKTSIVTDPKRIERPGAVLENMFSTAPTAVEE